MLLKLYDAFVKLSLSPSPTGNQTGQILRSLIYTSISADPSADD